MYSIGMVEGKAWVLWVGELILFVWDSCERGRLILSGTVELVQQEESVVVDIAAIVEICRIRKGRERDVLLILRHHFLRLFNRPEFLTFSLSSSHLILQNWTFALSSLSFRILRKLLVYFIGNFLFFLLFVALIFADQWIITIFYHMLSSGLIQKWDYLGPFLSILTDILEDSIIFCCYPVSVSFVVVQMVEPSFPTVLRWPKDGSIGDIEHFLGYLIPFPRLLLPDDVD